MKKIVFVLAFMMTAAIGMEGHNHNRLATISIQTFYDELSPYGDWIYTPDYGYVWRPFVAEQEEFTPYATAGNWVYTGLGWTWVSDYRWGWAPFHYGRWNFDDYLGWTWIPGNEWAPAWVTWGSYNDMWAWAPMGPNVRVNVSFNFVAPRFWWTFVPRQHFCSGNWYEYRYSQPVQVTNITTINNIYYNDNDRHHDRGWFYGPRVREVERNLGRSIRRMELEDSDKPGNFSVRHNRVLAYRPEVTTGRENVRPGKYRTLERQGSASQDQRTTGKNNIRREVQRTGRTIMETTGIETRSSGKMNRTRETVASNERMRQPQVTHNRQVMPETGGQNQRSNVSVQPERNKRSEVHGGRVSENRNPEKSRVEPGNNRTSNPSRRSGNR